MVERAAALAFLVLACATIALALPLRMYTTSGPGAGLFPLIIGVVMALLALAWLAQCWRGGDTTTVGRLDRGGSARVLAQVGALIAFTLALEPLGYIASAAALIALTALINGERSWAWIAVVVAIGSVGLSSALALLGTRI